MTDKEKGGPKERPGVTRIFLLAEMAYALGQMQAWDIQALRMENFIRGLYGETSGEVESGEKEEE